MKYIIVGNGYLGNKFLKYLPNSRMVEGRVESLKESRDILLENDPEWLINCAGATGRPNIDWCEDHKEETFNSNVLLPLNLAKACSEKNIRMMHLGSGCVYNGYNNGKGFSEDDDPNFCGSFYSTTKILSEQLLKEYNILQLRLRMPIDSELGPRNFITKIKNYEKVIDMENSMTIVEDLLLVGKTLMDRDKSGVYNVTNSGVMSHSEILDMYKEIVNPDFKYEVITLEELYKFTKSKRSNCYLNTEKLEREITIPPLKDRLKELMFNYRR